MKNKLIKIIEILLILCIIFSIYKVAMYYKSNKEFEKDNQEFEKIVQTSAENNTDKQIIVSQNKDKTEETPNAKPVLEEDNSQNKVLQELNHPKAQETEENLNPQDIILKLQSSFPNIIGRIIVNGTDIDFPVVQGKDNSFYLDHNYKNEYHPFGAVFMDARNSSDFYDKNSVLYGHNVRSGHVFHDLEKFKDENFTKKHPFITIDTTTSRKKYEIIAVYTASQYDDYRKPNYDGEEWIKFLQRINDKNLLPVTMPSGDYKLLTLSTCSDENDRLVIHAIETPHS